MSPKRKEEDENSPESKHFTSFQGCFRVGCGFRAVIRAGLRRNVRAGSGKG